MLTIILGIFEEGLVYAIMTLGVYITYKILDFPDLSVDGTFPLGEAITAAGIANGEDVYNTIMAGADATGSSSGVAKAADRAAMVDEMISAVRRAWDERAARA